LKHRLILYQFFYNLYWFFNIFLFIVVFIWNFRFFQRLFQRLFRICLHVIFVKSYGFSVFNSTIKSKSIKCTFDLIKSILELIFLPVEQSMFILVSREFLVHSLFFIDKCKHYITINIFYVFLITCVEIDSIDLKTVDRIFSVKWFLTAYWGNNHLVYW
jgi:hypothetical protein